MNVQLICGDSLEVLKTLPSQSVNCVVTSPPYWGLRNYGKDGQIGLEKTPEEYVSKLVCIFREVWRVLRDDGTLWINLGDSYASQGGPEPVQSRNPHRTGGSDSMNGGKSRNPGSLKPKDLVGIPWRVAFALQSDGWYLRSDIIWAKPNAMPESVRDRPTRSHEYIFLLTKKAKYYYDHNAIKEPCVNGDPTRPRGSKGVQGPLNSGRRKQDDLGKATYTGFNAGWADRKEPLKFRNKRSVWIVNTKPYRKAHFATFPPKLIEPCILAGTSEKGVCPICGNPWVRVTKRNEPSPTLRDGEWEEDAKNKGITGTDGRGGRLRYGLDHKTNQEKSPGYMTMGWKPTCNHESEPVPSVVLDPFGGAGTTALVSNCLGRNCISIDLNQDYIEMTEERLENGK